MSNRIGGDFNRDAVEAFRAAYAAQLMTPQDQDIDERTGLPTSNISNTSPWIESTGLWRYPSGKGTDEDLKQPFNPDEFISSHEDDSEEDDDEVSDEELDNLINELLGDFDEDED